MQATTSKTKATVVDGQPVIIMERMVAASPEAVWRAWEDPDAFAQWMGPGQTTITMQSSDFRVGGMRRYIMHVPEMGDFQNRTTYRELKAPQRLAYTHDSGVDNDPRGFEVVVTFTAKDGGTLVTIHSTFPSIEARDGVVSFGAVEYGKSSWDKMANFAEAHP
ncbi:MAG: glutathione S-transferase [Alphaproteobacteria bacterium]|nr:glutathione S-transferase [Alphaproteobacteria bacterium]